MEELSLSEIENLGWTDGEHKNSPGIWHGIEECESCGKYGFYLQWNGWGTLYALCMECHHIQGVACE